VHVYAQLSMIADGSVARANAEIGGHALTSMSAVVAGAMSAVVAGAVGASGGSSGTRSNEWNRATT
jgi:hypothetical protein